MRILVVESSRVQQIILNAIFKEYRFSPVFVDSVQMAREKLNSSVYELVFVSYHLPDGSGIDVARAVQALDYNQTNQVGVVLLTTEDKHIIFKEALSAGVTRIIFRANIDQIKAFLEEIVDTQFDFTDLEKHLLLVSNDSTVMRQFESTFEPNQIKVTTYASKTDVMAHYIDSEIDIVVIDEQKNDNELSASILKTIRSMSGIKSRVPIVILAEPSSDEREIQALKRGVNDYLVKPYSQDILYLRSNNLILQKKLNERLVKQRKQLEAMAMTDQLTTLFNRHFLVKYAPQRLAEAKRHGHQLSLIALDIDHFKKVNDTYGHEIGDEVLRQVAMVLRQSCRKEDMAVRFGGEEFLLVLPHCPKDSAFSKAESIRQQVEILRPENISISSSFGITYLPESDNDDIEFSDLFNAADDALYQAKKKGRNRTVIKPCR